MSYVPFAAYIADIYLTVRVIVPQEPQSLVYRVEALLRLAFPRQRIVCPMH